MMPHGKSPVVGLVQDLGERNLVKIWEWKYLGRVGPGRVDTDECLEKY